MQVLFERALKLKRFCSGATSVEVEDDIKQREAEDSLAFNGYLLYGLDSLTRLIIYIYS